MTDWPFATREWRFDTTWKAGIRAVEGRGGSGTVAQPHLDSRFRGNDGEGCFERGAGVTER